MKITNQLLLAVCIVVACTRMFSLDDFLFDPTTIDKYLRPEDFDSEWGTRFIIHDSLIEPVTLVSMGNRIYGFFVRGNPDSTTHNQVSILYFHGKDENINRYWARVEYLWEMGFNVFIFDYQGYGKSEGSPSGEALFSDGTEALYYLRSRIDVDASKIVLYGWSIGTFITTYCAADVLHPAAVILESAPASITALLRDSALLNLTGSYVTDTDFDNEKRIADIECPLLMMHGQADDFIVFERHVHLIWDAAHEPKDSLWVEDAGHDDIPEILGNEYHREVINFIATHVLQ